MLETCFGCDGARLAHGIGDQPGDSLRPYPVGDLDMYSPTSPPRMNLINRRLEVERRYGSLRRPAYREAEHVLAAAGITADLRGIDASALDASNLWVDRRVAWPWHRMADDFRRGHPDRFELAIWCQNVLCGLALGRARHHNQSDPPAWRQWPLKQLNSSRRRDTLGGGETDDRRRSRAVERWGCAGTQPSFSAPWPMRRGPSASWPGMILYSK